MRIDKFLKNSRLIKRRPVAKKACETGRVFINGKEAKPGTEVNAGDELEIRFGQETVSVRVKEIIENPRKDDAEKMYEMI